MKVTSRNLKGLVGFATFGAGLYTFSFFAVIVSLVVSDRVRRRHLLRKSASYMLKGFFLVLERLRLVAVRWQNSEILERAQGCVVVANHPSVIDALIILARFPEVNCLAKGELLERWCYRVAIDELGFIPQGVSSRVIEKCVETVESGEKVLIFPEGTRSSGAVVGEFSRGAAEVALRGGVRLIPVGFFYTEPFLQKKRASWFQTPRECLQITVKVFSPLNEVAVTDGEGGPAVSRRKLAHELTTRCQRMIESFVIGS